MKFCLLKIPCVWLVVFLHLILIYNLNWLLAPYCLCVLKWYGMSVRTFPSNNHFLNLYIYQYFVFLYFSVQPRFIHKSIRLTLAQFKLKSFQQNKTKSPLEAIKISMPYVNSITCSHTPIPQMLSIATKTELIKNHKVWSEKSTVSCF